MVNNSESEMRIASQERSREQQEVKESKELSPEAKAAAARERAEFLVKEVKTNTNQMQNIVMHMGQVQKAIKALRQQLQLQTENSAPSLAQDSERLTKLKKKIENHKEEIFEMKDDLLKMQKKEIPENNPDLSKEEVTNQAEQYIQNMLITLDSI